MLRRVSLWLLFACWSFGSFWETTLPAQEGAPQDGAPREEESPPGAVEDVCTKLTGCHSSHEKEKKGCGECGKRQIPSNDALCSGCARKAKLCQHCGRPKGKGGARRGGGTIQDAYRAIDPAGMKEFLTRFASDEFEGRQTGSAGIQKARAFLIEHLKKAGLRPAGSSFELPWGSCANIGAVYPGTDPKLRNEYIVVGSHYDHIGRKAGGSGDNINNGADDNGSGSTTNLSIAKALAESGIRTKRSILHLWFSGEEQGLNGSRAYCNSPAIPMAQTKAMLNCDMLGRNPGQAADLMGTGSSPQFAAAIAKAQQMVAAANVRAIEGKGEYFHRSDQANFWDKGVPVMFIFTGMHSDYHGVGDHADKIAYDRMAPLGRYMLTILVTLADHEGEIGVNPNFQ